MDDALWRRHWNGALDEVSSRLANTEARLHLVFARALAGGDSIPRPDLDRLRDRLCPKGTLLPLKWGPVQGYRRPVAGLDLPAIATAGRPPICQTGELGVGPTATPWLIVQLTDADDGKGGTCISGRPPSAGLTDAGPSRFLTHRPAADPPKAAVFMTLHGPADIQAPPDDAVWDVFGFWALAAFPKALSDEEQQSIAGALGAACCGMESLLRDAPATIRRELGGWCAERWPIALLALAAGWHPLLFARLADFGRLAHQDPQWRNMGADFAVTFDSDLLTTLRRGVEAVHDLAEEDETDRDDGASGPGGRRLNAGLASIPEGVRHIARQVNHLLRDPQAMARTRRGIAHAREQLSGNSPEAVNGMAWRPGMLYVDASGARALVPWYLDCVWLMAVHWVRMPNSPSPWDLANPWDEGFLLNAQLAEWTDEAVEDLHRALQAWEEEPPAEAGQAAVEAPVPTSAGREAAGEPLTPRALAVLELLRNLRPNQAMTGPQILDALAQQNPPILVDQSTLTKYIIPSLKPHGVKNRPRVGYYIEPAAHRIDAV